MYRYFLVLFCFFTTNYLFCSFFDLKVNKSKIIEINLEKSEGNIISSLQDQFKTSFFVGKILINRKGPVSLQMRNILEENSWLTISDLKKLCLEFKEKGIKLLRIVLKKNYIGFDLNFEIPKCWHLDEIKIRGNLDKYDISFYEQFYNNSLEKIFNEKRHLLVLQKIKRLLWDKGYFNCSLIDYIFCNKKNKKIFVLININKGDKYRILNSSCIIKTKDNRVSKSVNQLEIRINKFLEKRVKKKIFSKKLVNQQNKIIKKIILKNGFILESIKTKIETIQQKVKLNFDVKLASFLKIVFKGNNLVKSDELLEKITKKKLTTSDVIPFLKYYYNRLGYCDISIKSKKGKDFHEFYINEGKPVIISSVTIEDIVEKKSKNHLSVFFNKIRGKPFNRIDLKKNLDDLKNKFFNDGYKNFKILEKKLSRIDKNKWRLILKIYTGNKFSCEDLRIYENSVLDYEYSCIDDKVYANALSIFYPSKTQIIDDFSDNPFSLRIRSGFMQTNKAFTRLPTTAYSIGLSAIYKDIKTKEKIFETHLDYSRFSHNFLALCQARKLFDISFLPFLKAYSYSLGQPLISGLNESVYQELHQGFSSSFLQNYLLFNFNIMFAQEFIKVNTKFDQITDVIILNSTFLKEKIPFFIIEGSSGFSSLSNESIWFRQSGLFFFKIYFPYNLKLKKFAKFSYDHVIHYQIFNNLISAFRFKVGAILTSSFSSIIPTERFYLGGPLTIRSYEPYMVPPIKLFEDCNNKFWVPVGASSFFLVNAELRFNLYKWFSAVIFNDFGTLFENKILDFKCSNNAGATGFGLRLTTSLGAIGFDIGFKWFKRNPSDSPYSWYLTGGYAF